MTNTPRIRSLSMLVAVLVVVATAATVVVRLNPEPTVVETVSARRDPELPQVQATPPTPPIQRTPTEAPTTVASTRLPPTSTTSTTRTLRVGDTGAEVTELQARLSRLGYWLGRVKGTYGELTAQAVTAFEKVEALSPDGVADPVMRAALIGAERPVASSSSGNLIEVDKARQVLLVVRDGAVAWALNTSTGTEKPYLSNGVTEMADTPVGRWTVSWVVDGNDNGALGALYRPRYFHPDGIAVHGYHSVPAYPASHGCVRVTEAAMDWIWANNLMSIGSAVWVH